MLNPDQFPPPDLLDTAGRIKRLVIALAFGIAAGAATFLFCAWLVRPGGLYPGGRPAANARFIFSFTAFVGGGCFWLMLAIQNHFANKKWHDELMPRAQLRRR